MERFVLQLLKYSLISPFNTITTSVLFRLTLQKQANIEQYLKKQKGERRIRFYNFFINFLLFILFIECVFSNDSESSVDIFVLGVITLKYVF